MTKSASRAPHSVERTAAPNDKGYETDFPAMLLIQQTQRSAEALSCVRQTGKQTMTLHVLVVDDDEDVLTVLVEMLRDAGFCVTPAHSGGAMRDILGVENPAVDAVVLDCRMPGEPSAQLALHAKSPTLPVIMISGKSRPCSSLMRTVSNYSMPRNAEQKMRSANCVLPPNNAWAIAARSRSLRPDSGGIDPINDIEVAQVSGSPRFSSGTLEIADGEIN